jgi:hypothetical protein
MRRILLAMLVAVSVGLISASGESAGPVNGAAITIPAPATETLQQVKACGWRCTWNWALHKKVCWDPCRQREPVRRF